MEIKIKHEACIGCGICKDIDKENFEFDGEGYMTAINNNVTEKTLEAKNSCPVEAITIEKMSNK